MTNFGGLLHTLTQHGVAFILIGGAAATAHGASRLTLDLDIVYRRSPENIARVVASLAPYQPYLRGAPSGLPFRWDTATLQNGLNFTLTTSLGEVDLFGEIAGGGDYTALLPYCITLHIFGEDCLCLGLERLIYVKRAAGRPKDMEAIAELETLVEEQEQTSE